MGVGNIVTNVLMKVPGFLLLKKSALVFKAMRVLSACFDLFNVKKRKKKKKSFNILFVSFYFS